MFVMRLNKSHVQSHVQSQDVSREVLVNAIVCRDYSNFKGNEIAFFKDGIEFYSPGKLPNGITPKNIIKEQNSKNPTIAKVLAKVDYIEEVGEGWDKIVKEYEEHPLKPVMPKIESSENSVTVTLFSSKEKFESENRGENRGGNNLGGLSKNQENIMNSILKNKFISIVEISNFLGIGETTVEENISKLKEKKLLERIGSAKGGHWRILNEK